MLNITKKSENGIARIGLEGELDTHSAQELNTETEGFLDDVTDLTIDMKDLTYITSAGLRVLLMIEQIMEKQGQMRILHVGEFVMDVFEVCGFTEVMNIE